MIHLLQRLDDDAPRPALASKPPGLGPDLRPVTLLAEADETAVQALEDWTRGLDWVVWLFSSLRQRLSHLHFHPEVRDGALRIQLEWEIFSQGLLLEVCAPHLLSAWQAAQTAKASSLVDVDLAFSKLLKPDQQTSSLEAGRLLLKSTHGARYQGSLGHFRNAVAAAQCPGHFLTVWAAVGHFFQLSLANVIAEYLRLEWSLATRDLPSPLSLPRLPQITARLMQERPQELRVVA